MQSFYLRIMHFKGIPMGLSASVPLILKEKGVSYAALSMFSLVSLPFSVKLCWAPLVDSIYFPSIGRRKTWLIPVQMIAGLLMIYGSSRINIWMNEQPINVSQLTLFFGGLYFLMATQGNAYLIVFEMMEWLFYYIFSAQTSPWTAGR